MREQWRQSFRLTVELGLERVGLRVSRRRVARVARVAHVAGVARVAGLACVARCHVAGGARRGERAVT